MRKAIAALAGVAMLATSGCGAMRDSLRYPGGVIGRALDERTFDASQSKQLALLRATLALAIAARIGEGSVETADADVFARQMAEAANELNYAAVDAGYPQMVVGKGGASLETCTIEKGKLRGDLQTKNPGEIASEMLGDKTYAEVDAACAGYFVNFEANIARIKSRIARAMLTALPTDRARKFLEQLAGGNLLSALWSLAGATGDLAGAFHRGAGAYRAGLENVAASTPACDSKEPGFKKFGSYKQERDSVKVAALCLGLSETDLFDDETISAGELPNQIDPRAFLALFRIARTSCVALPLINEPANDDEFLKARKSRKASCDLVRFNPKLRPHMIELPVERADQQPGAVPDPVVVPAAPEPLPTVRAPLG